MTDLNSLMLFAKVVEANSFSVDNIASNHLSNVSGVLRLSAPPSISDWLLAPLVGAFQASYPNVRVRVFITTGLSINRSILPRIRASHPNVSP